MARKPTKLSTRIFLDQKVRPILTTVLILVNLGLIGYFLLVSPYILHNYDVLDVLGVAHTADNNLFINGIHIVASFFAMIWFSFMIYMKLMVDQT